MAIDNLITMLYAILLHKQRVYENCLYLIKAKVNFEI